MASYIDCYDTRRVGFIDRGTVKEERRVASPILEAEQHLLLANLGEVKLGRIKWLEDAVNPELGGPFLEVAALVQLGNEPLLPRDHLGFAGRHIIPEQTPVQPIFPLQTSPKINKPRTITSPKHITKIKNIKKIGFLGFIYEKYLSKQKGVEEKVGRWVIGGARGRNGPL